MCNYLGICALVAIFLCYFKRMFEIEPKRFGGITILNQIAHLKINEYTYNRKGSLILLCKMTRMVRRGLTTGTTQKHLGGEIKHSNGCLLALHKSNRQNMQFNPPTKPLLVFPTFVIIDFTITNRRPSCCLAHTISLVMLP